MALKEGDVLQGSFSGRSSAGSISLPGARVGDVLLNLYISYPPDNYWGSFENTISVDNQIQQTSGSDYSPYTLKVTLFRPVAVG
jgi:hypothetical protein